MEFILWWLGKKLGKCLNILQANIAGLHLNFQLHTVTEKSLLHFNALENGWQHLCNMSYCGRVRQNSCSW